LIHLQIRISAHCTLLHQSAQKDIVYRAATARGYLNFIGGGNGRDAYASAMRNLPACAIMSVRKAKQRCRHGFRFEGSIKAGAVIDLSAAVHVCRSFVHVLFILAATQA
jgi:hypothetical protein